MPPPTMITAIRLTRLVGQSDAPALIDVRIGDDYALDPRTKAP